MFSPLFSNVPHEVEEEFSVEGIKFKKGFYSAVIFRFMMYNENNFEKADKFMPERWMEGVKKMKEYSYTPFSAGPRNCIG